MIKQDRLIPSFIIDNFLAEKYSGSFAAPVIFADISGFSSLTEVVTGIGSEGAEILSDLINRIFSRFIYFVHGYGGYIASFSGDAFLAVFDRPIDSARACIDIMDYIKAYGQKSTRYGTFNVSAKISASYGEVRWGIVGTKERRTYYFSGEAVRSACGLQVFSNKNEILIDHALMNIIKHESSLEFARDGIVRLKGIKNPGKIKTEKRYDITGPMGLDMFLGPCFKENRPVSEIRYVASVYVSIDDEDKDHEWLNLFADELIYLSQKWGGFFNNIRFDDKGASVLVCFGIPVSYEDDIERALFFSNELIYAYPESVRVGINYGRLFSGIIGSDSRATYDIIGNSVNISARIAMLARWGETLVLKSIKDMTFKHFLVRRHKKTKLKGINTEVEIYGVLRKLSSPLMDYQNRFYGREVEISSIKDKLNNIRSKKPPFHSTIYIYGPPGTGKSRLVHEISNDEALSKYFIIFHCDNLFKKSWNLFIQFFKSFFGVESGLSSPEKERAYSRKMDSFLAELGLSENSAKEEIIIEIKRAQSCIKALLSLDTKDSLYEDLNARLRYENTQAVIIQFLKGLSILRPAIFVFEDIQWMDKDSRSLLEVFLTKPENYPISMIFTARHKDDGSVPGLKSPEDSECVIELGGLPDKEASLKIREILGKRPDNRLFSFIKERTQNNPFFIEQFCYYLLENKFLTAKDDKYSLREKSIPDEVPSKISHIILSRIDRLTKELQELLRIASVFGREFDSDILMKVMQDIYEQAFIHDNVIGEHFDENVLKSLLHGRRPCWLSQGIKLNLWDNIDKTRYRFKNTLINETAYNVQIKDRTRFIHSLIAKTLEAVINICPHENADLFPLVAYHFEKAEIIEKAKEYIEKSAVFLEDTYKNHKAIEYYEKLLSLTLDSEKVIKYKLKIGDIYERTSDFINAEKIYRECKDFSENILNMQITALAYDSYGHLLSNMGSLKESDIILLKALRLSHELGDKKLNAKVKLHLGIDSYYRGKYEEAEQYYHESLSFFNSIGDKQGKSLIINNLGELYRDRGLYKKALSCYRSFKTMAEEQKNKQNIGISQLNIGTVYYLLSRLDKAMGCFCEYLKISKEIGDKRGIGIATGNIGSIYYKQGKFKEAIESYLVRKKVAEEIGDQRGLGLALNNLASVSLMLGDLNRSIIYSKEKSRVSEETGDLIGKALADGVLGRAYYYLREYKKALEYLNSTAKILQETSSEQHLLEHLLLKVSVLYETKHIKEAEKINNEALQIAETLKDHSCLLKCRINKLRIISFYKEQRRSAINGLISLLLELDENSADHAEVSYILYDLTKNNSYRQNALHIYEQLYRTEPQYDYKLKISSLKQKCP